MYRKKEKWVATWRGHLLKLVIFIVLILLYVKTIVSFLAPVNTMNADVLVVEGYLPDYAILESIKVFNNGNYKYLVLTGKKRSKGAHLDMYANDGAYSAATLEKVGFDMSKVVVVVARDDIRKDRTFYSAIALNDWLQSHHPDFTSVDLVSLGCHSRRSQRLFQKALIDKFEVGIYAVQNQSYEQDRWWRSSHGFREVTKESLAWVYARFFFFPPE